MAAPIKSLSLDTNFLFDLAAKEDFAHDLLESFRARGYSFVLPPTAALELHLIFTNGISKERKLAYTALTGLRLWRIRPFDLDSTAEVISDRFVRNLVLRGLLPEEEFNDGLILAESSIEGIPILVTSDKHLLNIDPDALLSTFHESDLAAVLPVHPKRLIRILT